MARKTRAAAIEASTPPAPRSHWRGLLLLAAVALSIRLFYLFELRDSVFLSVLIGDSLEYDTWALRISGGDWVGRDVFYQSPLYPYFLALVYTVAGHHVFVVRVLQAMFGSLSCMLLAIAGRQFFDARTGYVAGGLLAVYPAAIFFDGLIQKSSLDLLFVTSLLAALGMSVERPQRRWIVAAGVAFGALALNRENARILFPVVAAWFLLFHRLHPLKQRVARAALFTAAAAAVLLPVALRNQVVGGEFAISTSQAGPNFYIGNHIGASGGYDPLVPGRGNALFEREDATRLAQAATGRPLSAAEVSNYWWGRATADIRQAPGSWLRLLARKAWLTVSGTEPLDTESLEAYTEHSGLLLLLQWFTFAIVLGLAAGGVWATRRQWRRLWLLHAVFAALALSIVMFYVFARYRFPLVPVAMLFAGAGVTALAGTARSSRERAVAAVVAVVVAAVLHIPIRTSADETYSNYGSELVRRGRTSEALPLLREAVKNDPSHEQARMNLALALQKSGQVQASIEEFRAAIKLNPSLVEAHLGLAIALHQQGQPRDAIAAYEKALRLKPDSIEAMSNMAIALQEVGNPAAAVALLGRALELEPGNVALRMNQGRLLMMMGRSAEAIDSLRQAAERARKPDESLQAEYALAEVLAREGRIAEAIAHMERAQTAARAAGDSAALTSIQAALAMLRGR